MKGLANTIKSISCDKTGYKGIAGEISITTQLIKSGVDPDAIHLQKSLDEDDVPETIINDKRFKDVTEGSTDIDIKTENHIRVNSEELTGIAIESKNLNPHVNEFIREQTLIELERKLRTHAAAGEDEIIVVMTGEYLDMEKDALDKIADDVRELIKSMFDREVQIKFTSYHNIGE